MSNIELGGSIREIKFGFSSLSYLKREHGFKTVEEVFESLGTGDFTIKPVLLTAFMIGEQESPTVENTEIMLDNYLVKDGNDMKKIMAILEDVIINSILVKGLDLKPKKGKAEKKK